MSNSFSISSRFSSGSRRGLLAACAMAVLALGAVQYAPSAEARGGGWHGGGHGYSHGGGVRWGGALVAGALIGGAVASSYYYNSYYSPYYAPAYYPPAYYPPAAYAPPAPVTYVEQQPTYAAAAPAAYASAPQAYAAPPVPAAQQMTIEQRAQRLKAMCDQRLFTPQECSTRRAELMREM